MAKTKSKVKFDFKSFLLKKGEYLAMGIAGFFLFLLMIWAIGKASARGLARILADGGADRAADAVAAAPAKARTGLASTLSLLGAVDATTAVSELVEACRGAVDPLLRAHYPDWQRRVTEVDGIAQAAALQSDLRSFVSEQAIDPVVERGFGTFDGLRRREQTLSASDEDRTGPGGGPRGGRRRGHGAGLRGVSRILPRSLSSIQ